VFLDLPLDESSAANKQRQIVSSAEAAAAFRGPTAPLAPRGGSGGRRSSFSSVASLDPFFPATAASNFDDDEQEEEEKVEGNAPDTAVVLDGADADARGARRSPGAGIITSDSPFALQVRVLFRSDWKASRPACINALRVIEVVGLAVLTGVAFYSVGSNTTNRGFRESISLLFFSMTLWTFNRMYPAVMSYNSWRQTVILDGASGRYSVAAACLSRTLVLLCAESWWPFLYCLVCFPLARISGDFGVVLLTGFFLSLNLMCYISIGSLLGTVIGTVSWGMIAATLFSQTTIMCAGFYTTLPPFLSAFRYRE